MDTLAMLFAAVLCVFAALFLYGVVTSGAREVRRIIDSSWRPAWIAYRSGGPLSGEEARNMFVAAIMMRRTSVTLGIVLGGPLLWLSPAGYGWLVSTCVVLLVLVARVTIAVLATRRLRASQTAGGQGLIDYSNILKF